MAFVDVNPRYRALSDQLGLRTPADFFALHGVLVGGHAERDIAHITLGDGPQRLTGYLKREVRIRWRDRVRSAVAGFGLVSRCYREAKLLQRLGRAHIGCPEIVAVGEDNGGRSFLLVRELSDAQELRQFLSEALLGRSERRRFARRLGRALARIHQAGFLHRDLYSKHVLVRTGQARDAEEFAFVDWQRSRQRRHLTWSHCWRDLAAVDATLADELAAPRERLACLGAYLRSWKTAKAATMPSLSQAARAIRRRALQLQRRQRIAEMRQLPFGTQQSCIKFEGQGVSLTRQFREEVRGDLPSWLQLDHSCLQTVSSVMRVTLPVVPPRQARLVRRQVHRPLWRLWRLLGGTPAVSPEVRQAGTLVRLERYGIRVPRLLAYGQHANQMGHTEALLLTEDLKECTPLPAWLECAPLRSSAVRRRLLHEAGNVMRRMHAAACYFARDSQRLASALSVQMLPDGSERIVLANAAVVRRRQRHSARHAGQDLAALLGTFDVVCSRTDILRFLLAYLDQPHLNRKCRSLIRRIRRLQPRVPRSIPWRLGAC